VLERRIVKIPILLDDYALYDQGMPFDRWAARAIERAAGPVTNIKFVKRTAPTLLWWLPPGLAQAARLDEPLFTPATKAAVGDHDENISFDTLAEIIGRERAMQVRQLSLRIYSECADYARQRGIIIADTKFEFGVDEAGKLYLIDEVLTPDSSRFWPAASWRTGASPPSFDKQFVRDYLDTLDWDKRAPGPRLPAEVIARTREKYLRALELLTGESGSQAR